MYASPYPHHHRHHQTQTNANLIQAHLCRTKPTFILLTSLPKPHKKPYLPHPAILVQNPSIAVPEHIPNRYKQNEKEGVGSEGDVRLLAYTTPSRPGMTKHDMMPISLISPRKYTRKGQIIVQYYPEQVASRTKLVRAGNGVYSM